MAVLRLGDINWWLFKADIARIQGTAEIRFSQSGNGQSCPNSATVQTLTVARVFTVWSELRFLG
jgi:hypothetical protein